MTLLSFAQVDQVLECSRRFSVRYHPVSDPRFRLFCRKARAFERDLGPVGPGDAWEPFATWLRRYRYRCIGTPLPFDHPQVYQPERLVEMGAWMQGMFESTPDLVTAARELVRFVQELGGRVESPLLAPVLRFVQGAQRGTAAVLVRDARMISLVDEVLKPRLGNLAYNTVRPHQLRGGECFDRLVVVGPPTWLPDYLWQAPRTQDVCLVYYDWLPAQLHTESVLSGSVYRPPGGLKGQRVAPRIPNAETVDDVEIRHILPLISADALVDRAVRGSALDGQQEKVSAYLVRLDGERAVFLNAEPRSKQLVLELDLEGQPQVHRMDVRSLEPGLFVLLRTAGGGDYVVHTANQILGDRAAHMRREQARWKSRLRDRVEQRTLEGVATQLRAMGCRVAEKNNVRYWMSPDNIRTDQFTDFAVIMRFLGLEEEAESIWAHMGEIDRAHLAAGQRIRELLLAQVAAADLSTLEREGHQEFSLDEDDQASLTAFRVEEVYRESVMVSAGRLGRPFELEE